MSVSHYAAGVGPADLINLDDGSVLVDDLAYGATSDVLELSVAGAYNLGIDIDQDGNADALLPPIAENDFTAGDSWNVSAVINPDAEVMFALSGIGAGDEGRENGFVFGLLSPYTPPLTVAEMQALLPYSSNGYQAFEQPAVGNPSAVEIVAPEGTASITLVVNYDFEDFSSAGTCFDELVFVDSMGVEYRDDYCGDDITDLEITIPGAYVLVGVDSDFGTQRDGYTITSITANEM